MSSEINPPTPSDPLSPAAPEQPTAAAARPFATLRVVLPILAIAGGIFAVVAFSMGGRTKDPDRPTFVTFSAYEARQVKSLYMQNCASCHGTRGQGMPRQGSNLRESEYVKNHSDQQLVRFLVTGRSADAHDNVLGVPMPARGGNDQLDEQQLRSLVGYMRFLQTPAGAKELR
ncbi:MAG TPA: cytochrome c [Tepidisphaeraceae bacterium]|nr:cytochrome c [Tepidisphaeraceae bacterium]